MFHMRAKKNESLIFVAILEKTKLKKTKKMIPDCMQFIYGPKIIMCVCAHQFSVHLIDREIVNHRQRS